MTKDYIEAVYNKHNKWLAAGKYEHMTKDYIEAVYDKHNNLWLAAGKYEHMTKDYIEAVYDKHTTTYGLLQGNMSTRQKII